MQDDLTSLRAIPTSLFSWDFEILEEEGCVAHVDLAWLREKGIRIAARDGKMGKPTPEGVHRDGVDFVIVVMIKRVNIDSGATTIYDLDNTLVGEFTLLEAFDMVLVNDRKLYHGVTPITQLDPDSEAARDGLIESDVQQKSRVE